MSKRNSKPSNRPGAGNNTHVRVTRDISPHNDDVIVVNTDGKRLPKPGDDLFSSRNNKMIETLGDKSQLVSVMLVGYNRLEKTKTSLESLLKYTTDIDFELVLVDNGSTDETLDYFKSLKYSHKKIVRVTKNLGAFVSAWELLSGRYLVGIANDVYVTKNWLTNMLKCLTSDDRIGMVVPVSSNVSNYQNADIHFDTIDEMWEKAAQYNVSNPRKWHERLRLMPIVGLYKREALDMAGKLDYGFFHDFADDDISFRIRRTGYKTVLCRDTFIHHDHDIFNMEDKNPEEFKRSIDAGRNDFIGKYYGIDAWSDVNNYENVMMSLVEPQEYEGHDSMDILGVDVLCGTPILELKNKLREARVYNSRLSAFSTDAKYWLDLKTICEGEVFVDRIEHLSGYFSDLQFDYIILGKPINAYNDPYGFLGNLLKLLKNNGHLLIKLRNTYDAVALITAMGGNMDISKDAYSENFSVYQIRIEELLTQVKNLGFINKKIALELLPLDDKTQKVVRDLITNSGLVNDPNDAFNRVAARDYIIDIVRKGPVLS